MEIMRSSASIVFSIESPAFHTVPPAVSNRDLIPSRALRAMETSWNKRNFKSCKIEGHLLKGGFVVGEGLVFDQDFNVFEPAIWPATDADVEKARVELVRSVSSKTIEHRTRRAVLCRKPGNENYGHWSIEMFPKALLARDNLGQIDALVHDAKPGLRQSMTEMLSAVDWPDENLVWRGDDPIFFDELLIVTGLTRHGSFMSPIAVDMLRRCRCVVQGEALDANAGASLYVSRGAATKRRLLNEDVVWAKLQSDGYIRVDPGAMTFAQQVASFSNARRVAGVIGAAMTNIVFCRENTEVKLLVPCTMPDTFFWFISQHRKLNYNELRCSVQESSGERSWNRPFSFDDILALTKKGLK